MTKTAPVILATLLFISWYIYLFTGGTMHAVLEMVVSTFVGLVFGYITVTYYLSRRSRGR